MANLTRLSVSIEACLLDRFLELGRKRGVANRSEAVRNLMRDCLLREEWQGDEEIVGAIGIVYDHHKHELHRRLTSIQHEHHDAVLAVTRIHLDHDDCLEMIACAAPRSRHRSRTCSSGPAASSTASCRRLPPGRS